MTRSTVTLVGTVGNHRETATAAQAGSLGRGSRTERGWACPNDCWYPALAHGTSRPTWLRSGRCAEHGQPLYEAVRDVPS